MAEWNCRVRFIHPERRPLSVKHTRSFLFSADGKKHRSQSSDHPKSDFREDLCLCLLENVGGVALLFDQKWHYYRGGKEELCRLKEKPSSSLTFFSFIFCFSPIQASMCTSP